MDTLFLRKSDVNDTLKVITIHGDVYEGFFHCYLTISVSDDILDTIHLRRCRLKNFTKRPRKRFYKFKGISLVKSVEYAKIVLVEKFNKNALLLNDSKRVFKWP